MGSNSIPRFMQHLQTPFKRYAETPFKVVSIEAYNRMVLVIRVKEVFEIVEETNSTIRIKPKKRVIQYLTRKLENLNEILSEY